METNERLMNEMKTDIKGIRNKFLILANKNIKEFEEVGLRNTHLKEMRDVKAILKEKVRNYELIQDADKIIGEEK